ncbi:hypothetical protein LCGC14_1656720, partial [marine sediment metagenome]
KTTSIGMDKGKSATGWQSLKHGLKSIDPRPVARDASKLKRKLSPIKPSWMPGRLFKSGNKPPEHYLYGPQKPGEPRGSEVTGKMLQKVKDSKFQGYLGKFDSKERKIYKKGFFKTYQKTLDPKTWRPKDMNASSERDQLIRANQSRLDRLKAAGPKYRYSKKNQAIVDKGGDLSDMPKPEKQVWSDDRYVWLPGKGEGKGMPVKEGPSAIANIEASIKRLKREQAKK